MGVNAFPNGCADCERTHLFRPPYNVIPSSDITMKNVESPILGIDNLGNSIEMQPGKDYSYPGDVVLEFKLGTKNKNKIYNKIFKK